MGSKMRNEGINQQREESGGVRRRPAAGAQAIEKKSQDIGADKNRGGLDGVGEVVDGDQTGGGDVENHIEPEIPGNEKADAVVESQAGPFIKAPFEGHHAIQMGDDERLGNEEQKNGEEPENDVSETGFYGSAEEIGNYDEEDGGKNEVQVAEFLTEGGAALVEMRFCCGEIRANAGGQCTGEPRDLRRAW